MAVNIFVVIDVSEELELDRELELED